MNNARFLLVAMSMIILLLVTACGDRNSPPVVTGVAATGIPISGSITLKDQAGLQRGPVPSDLNGNFVIDVAGLMPPYVLKAEWISRGQSYTLFSVATSAGRTHVNPLTDLLVYLAANTEPALIFGTPGAPPDTTNLSRAALASALAKLRTLLMPLLVQYNIQDFDPLNGAYTAAPQNHLDAMLDVISLSRANGIVTITNRLTGAVIATGDPADMPSMTFSPNNVPDASVLNDIKDLTQRLAVLRAAMNLEAALTVNDLEGFFLPDPYYGTSSGLTRTADMDSIVAIFGPHGTNTNGRLSSIQNVRLVSDLTANYGDRGISRVYLLNYDFIHENGTVVHGNNVTFGKELSSGLWKFIGDPDQGAGGNNYGFFATCYSVTNTLVTVETGSGISQESTVAP